MEIELKPMVLRQEQITVEFGSFRLVKFPGENNFYLHRYQNNELKSSILIDSVEQIADICKVLNLMAEIIKAPTPD